MTKKADPLAAARKAKAAKAKEREQERRRILARMRAAERRASEIAIVTHEPTVAGG